MFVSETPTTLSVALWILLAVMTALFVRSILREAREWRKARNINDRHRAPWRALMLVCSIQQFIVVIGTVFAAAYAATNTWSSIIVGVGLAVVLALQAMHRHARRQATAPAPSIS